MEWKEFKKLLRGLPDPPYKRWGRIGSPNDLQGHKNKAENLIFELESKMEEGSGTAATEERLDETMFYLAAIESAEERYASTATPDEPWAESIEGMAPAPKGFELPDERPSHTGLRTLLQRIEGKIQSEWGAVSEGDDDALDRALEAEAFRDDLARLKPAEAPRVQSAPPGLREDEIDELLAEESRSPFSYESLYGQPDPLLEQARIRQDRERQRGISGW